MAFNNPVNAKQTAFQSITTTGVWNGRTLTAGSGISISNGDGISANPVISATGAGDIIQQVRNRTTTAQTSTSSIIYPTTLPTLLNTTSVITASITPTSASNALVIQFCTSFSGIGTSWFFIFQDGVFKSGTTVACDGVVPSNSVNFLDYLTSGTTSSTTIDIRCSDNNSNDLNMLRTTAGAHFFGATGSATVLIVTEMSV